MRLLIYSPNVSPRIKYIFNFIFREILKCDFEFTSISADFEKSTNPKISYAENPLNDELFFRCSSLLTKHTIEPIAITTTYFGDQEVPFVVKNSTLPFDVFAASFYFLSRYEEYLPFTTDEHGRYPAEQSLQYRLNLLTTPVIDGWALILKNILLKKFPNLTFGKRKFKFIPTINIDRGSYLKSSGLVKNTTQILKAALKLDTQRVIDILLAGLRPTDAFNTYEYLAAIHARHQLSAIFFFSLETEDNIAFDKNMGSDHESFTALIRKVALVASIGLHPSSVSNETTKIREELISLRAITNHHVDASRQHFLKLSLPHTYLKLIKAGINHDYSMGYASQIGFKAGTCTPFFWYDLQLEKQSHLTVHPFALMDVTLQHYLSLHPDQAIAKIESLIAAIKLVDGTLHSVWHNESVSETGKWKGWKTVYEYLLQNAH